MVSNHRTRKLLSCFLFLMVNGIAILSTASAPSRSSGGVVTFRVRLEDGSIQRVQVPSELSESITLREVVSKVQPNLEGRSIHLGSSCIQDDTRTVSELGLESGTVLTVKSSPDAKSTSLSSSGKGPTSLKSIQKTDHWDPFPDLAKDYQSAILQTKKRRSGSRGLSYGDLAAVQSSLHVVEPQKEGPVKRVYICRVSAERFQSNCINHMQNKVQNQVGLLLGTLQSERADAKPRPRTSLSTPPSAQEYWTVAKVHAIWVPPSSGTKETMSQGYDPDGLVNFRVRAKHVVQVAQWLGLQPVGWIFSYSDDRHKNEDSLPVNLEDVKVGALLQIENMKAAGRTDGSRFVTIAMNGETGATEAFQLSDVSVQIVAENLIENPKGQFGTTKHAILVDGRETNQLDSVLCLVNTAMLGHVGSFAGTVNNSVGKKGDLTNKTRKAILKAIKESDDESLLALLCDFNIILSLRDGLGEKLTQSLCRSIQKWAQGQKKGAVLEDPIKLRLASILDH